jgi:multidrug resistance efflux pump
MKGRISRRLVTALGILTALTLVILWKMGATPENATVLRGPFTVDVEIAGNLRAVESSQIGPPTIEGFYNFKISMMAPEGVEVHQGMPVLAFDTSEQSRKLLSRRAEVKSSAKQIEQKEIDILKTKQDQALELAEARARLRRAELKTAAPSELVSGIDTQRAKLQLELAHIEVESLKRKIAASTRAAQAELAGLKSDFKKAEMDVRRIEDAIKRMTRIAPRTGVVTYISDWRGEKMKVGDRAWRRAKILEIPDLTRMEAEGEVEEALAGRLLEGQRVSLTLDAHPDRQFSGVIKKISRSVQEKSWQNPLKVVRILISLEETDPERMRPGMHFKGSVEVERLANALMIPIDSIVSTSKGPVTLRHTPWGTETVPIMTGSRDDTRVVVLEGLEEGDRVSAPPGGQL